MITKKMETIRIFVTPNDLIELSEKIKKSYETRQPGQTNIVHTIRNDPDNYSIDICFDQYRIEKELNNQSNNEKDNKVILINEPNKRQDEEYNNAIKILNEKEYYLVCIDCGFKVKSSKKLPKYNDHECPGKLQHTFRAFKPGDVP